MDPKNIIRLYKMAFAGVYPHYVTKVEKKGRTVAELHEVIFWLTGYNEVELQNHIEAKTNFEDFFAQAPIKIILRKNTPIVKSLLYGSLLFVFMLEIV